MSKSIILCCDGTTNQMTGHETNVLRLYRALVHDPQQLTFYDPGVGTLADPMTLSAGRKFVQRKLDAAIGRSLCQNFSDTYRFLAQHYEPGDDVCLFGFSRGAYTARAVAGAVHMLGLLRPELVHLTPYVWAIYANDGGAYDVKTRFGGAPRFHEMFCVPDTPRVKLLGLWDTVSSFGWFWDFQTLPYTANNPSVDLVRHAISIDEHRAAFPTNLVTVPGNGRISSSEQIKQVWFAGVHADVGGGYPDEEGGLSKIALQWMVTELMDLGGLRFRQDVLDEVLGVTGTLSRPDPNADPHESLTGMWGLMEWLPRRRWRKKDEGAHRDARAPAAVAGPRPALWVKSWKKPHLYRRRTMPPDAWIHPSVRARQAARGYNPPLPANCIDLAYVPGRGFLPKGYEPVRPTE